MRHTPFTLLLSALALVPTARAQDETPEPAPQAVNDLVAGNTRFALELYARLRTGEGNIAFSPHSLATALAMTRAAARGETAAEMDAVLHFPIDPEALQAAVARLGSLLQVPASADAQPVELSVANALWSDVRESIRPGYLDLLRTHYAGGAEQLDFSQAAQAAGAINAWTSEHTHDRVPELVTPNDVAGASFVLTNAIAFRGEWALPFDPDRTVLADFHIAPGRDVQVPMMTRTGEARVGTGQGFTVLELPFADGRHVMDFLLPDAVDGLEDLEARLDADLLTACLDDLPPGPVSIAVPRFELRSRFELAPLLSEMGMPTAFSAKADFTGMIAKPGVFLSRVIHEAFVEVDEQGAEAAAATAVIAKRSAAPAPFRADHPFLFLIRDHDTGELLFLGRFVAP